MEYIAMEYGYGVWREYGGNMEGIWREYGGSMEGVWLWSMAMEYIAMEYGYGV